MAGFEYDISDILERTGLEKGFESEKDFDPVKIGERMVEFSEPVGINGILRNVGHGILAEGFFKTAAKLECSRCLDDFQQNISGEIEELFVHDRTRYDEEEKEVFFIKGGKTVDLEPAVYQLVISEIPFKPLCRKDCAGICQVCGKNLNREPHVCQEESIDIRMSTLRDFFKKNEES